MNKYPYITARVFVNAPFDQLQKGFIDILLKNRIQPEVGLPPISLEQCSDAEFREIAEVFRKAGLACTLHAPFAGLDPCSGQANYREHARDTIKKALRLARFFKPKSMVCHPNIMSSDFRELHEERVALAIDFWREMAVEAELIGVPLMLENTYETSPAGHLRVFTAIASPFIRYCMDTGHVNSFAKATWQDFLPTLQPWLGQLHLHDNDGSDDQHKAIGLGTFDFSGFFAHLHKYKLTPIITLEPHTEEDLWESLEALNRMGLVAEEAA